MRCDPETRLLITGGEGFIATALTRRAAKVGWKIYSYDIRQRCLKLPSIYFQGDVRDSTKLGEVLNQVRPTVIVHAAAQHFVPVCESDPERTWSINVEGTINLLECIQHSVVSSSVRLIFTSSGAVYGESRFPHSEDDPIAPISVYANSKVECEGLIMRSNLSAIIMRLFNVYGPHNSTRHLIPEIIRQLQSQNANRILRLGNLNTIRDFVYLEDVAEALLSVAASSERWTTQKKIYNVASGVGYSVTDVVTVLGRVLGRTFVVNQVSNAIRERDVAVLIGNNCQFKTEFEWNPIQLEDGLRLTACQSGLLKSI